MRAHRLFPVHEPSQVGEARRAAVAMAERLGLDEQAAGRLALVVTELGNNLVRHAVEGRLLIAPVDGEEGPAVEVLSLDAGPGMTSLAECLRDGYSTAGTPGTGLGAVQRLSDCFEGHTTRPGGTVLMARIARRRVGSEAAAPVPRYRHGAVSVPAPGESVCGDSWSVVAGEQGVAVMVADGLGHGPGAAEAAEAAREVFEAAPFEPAERLLERAHARLRSTRGAALAVAQLDGAKRVVVFAGAGNIAGRLLSGVAERSLLSQHGTVGLRIRRPAPISYDWPEHAVLVLHSDGIATRWDLSQVPALLMCHPVVIAAWLLREHARGRDDATVVVVRQV